MIYNMDIIIIVFVYALSFNEGMTISLYFRKNRWKQKSCMKFHYLFFMLN